MYSDITIPSFHSAGTFPDIQAVPNRPCRALLTGSMAHFNSSGGISSAPAARPFFSLRIACWTSSRERCPGCLHLAAWYARHHRAPDMVGWADGSGHQTTTPIKSPRQCKQRPPGGRLEFGEGNLVSIGRFPTRRFDREL